MPMIQHPKWKNAKINSAFFGGGRRSKYTPRPPVSKSRRVHRGRYARQSLQPFPMSKIVKLRYVDYAPLAGGGVGAPGYYVFSANSLYDPNTTGTGHQPMHFDTMATMYNHYVVLGAKITVRAWGEATSGGTGAVLACKLDDDGSATFNNGRLMEQGSNLVKYIIMRDNVTAGKSYGVLKHTYSARKFHGVKDVDDNKYTLGALTNASPSDQGYWVIHWQHPDNSTVMGSIKLLVQIDYIVKFSEPRDFPQS